MRNRVWPWLAAIVVISAGVRIALGRHVIAPWIMVDELIYSELAKSFAASGHFQIRGVASNGYGFVYPALIAPAWKAFGPMPTVYEAAKVINAIVMSLAAVPAYFLARRVLAPGLSLCAAVLAVAIPPMLYTSELMTENAFYPLFLVVVWALVATLERPTPRRQVGVLALCGVAFATRQQAVALVPAVAIAPALLGWIERDLKPQLRAWLTTYAILVGAFVLAVGGTLARGRSPLTLLGAYRAATSVPYSFTSVLHYILWHIAELDLALGVVPFVALLALWVAPRAGSPGARAFAAATLPVTLLVVVEVAIFASTQSGRIEERNMFYVMPFALIALLGFAEIDVIERRRWPVLVAALVAGGLPATIPLGRFITTSALSDTFGLMPWWWIQDRGIHFDTLRFVALAAGLLAAAAVVLVPRPFTMVLVGLVALYFVMTGAVVQNGRHGIVQASRGAVFAGIRNPHYDWVDRAVGRDADVTQLWSNDGAIQRVWENEFFNRSVMHFADIGNAFTGGLPEQTLHERSDGALVTAAGRPATARYALASQTSYLAGRTVAVDRRAGVIVVRVNGPLVVLVKVTGIYPNDTWSGRTVRYFRRHCTSGSLSVQLQSDPELFDQANLVRSGRRAISVPRTSDVVTFLVPLVLHANRTCTATFTVRDVRVPADLVTGSTDTRPLGVHFLHFYYLP
jgi:hypothetical protein